MSLDVVETPRSRPASPPNRAPRHAGPPGHALDDRPARTRGQTSAHPPAPAPIEASSRPPARHRRRRDPAELADRLWRPPLGLAAGIFAACGPVHALGHTGLVFDAVLVGLALSAVAVPLGLFGMRNDGPADPAAGGSPP